jgi:hypothetical protein
MEPSPLKSPIGLPLAGRAPAARAGLRLATAALAVSALALGAPVAATAAVTPWSQCPAVGASTGCSALLTLKADGTGTIAVDAAQTPYDGSSGTLIGIQNDSGRTLTSVTLDAARGTVGGFQFTGGPPCQYVPAPAACATLDFGSTTGYSGPGNSFSAVNGNGTRGTVDFAPGLKSGGSGWFALAQDLTAAQLALVGAPVFAPGSALHPVVAFRALDSRTGTGFAGPLATGTPRDLTVAGAGGIPLTASAVVMTLTATASTDASNLTVWPTGTTQPDSSNLSMNAGQTIANLVTVPVGTAGMVRLATAAGSAQVIGDVVGYYDDGTGAGDRYTGITPTRVLDSRTATGGWTGPLVAGTVQDLAVTGEGSSGLVPATATAVAANVTVTGASEASYLVAWPSGVPRPATSNLNVDANGTRGVGVLTKIGANGKISFDHGAGSLHVVVDVVGYFDPTTGGRFHPVPPARYLDSRIGRGVAGLWNANETKSLVVASTSGVAADATGLVTNVTAAEATAGTFVTAHPTGVARPASSQLNLGPGEMIANLVTTKIGTGGAVSFYNDSGSVQLIGDAVGFYAPT